MFDVAEADLDDPGGGVGADDVGGGGGQVGGEEVVVGLMPVGVSHDDQADQVGLVDPVPEHVAGVDQTGPGGAADVNLNLCPAAFGHGLGQLCGGGEPFALGARTSTPAGAWWHGLVEGGVAAQPRGEEGEGLAGPGEGGVGAVGAQWKDRSGNQPVSSRIIAAAWAIVVVASC